MDDTLPWRLGRAAANEQAATEAFRAVLAEAFDESDLSNAAIARYTRHSVDSVRVRRRRHEDRKAAAA